MGCRKLTYRETLSPLKVVYNDLIINENCYVGNYRYGFNGMERDDKVKGAGNSYDFGARIYDPRVGRWLSRDALESKYPSISTYSFVGNSPIFCIDPDGKKIRPTNEPASQVIGAVVDQFNRAGFNIAQNTDGDIYEAPDTYRKINGVEGGKIFSVSNRKDFSKKMNKYMKSSNNSKLSEEKLSELYIIYLGIKSPEVVEVQVTTTGKQVPRSYFNSDLPAGSSGSLIQYGKVRTINSENDKFDDIVRQYGSITEGVGNALYNNTPISLTTPANGDVPESTETVTINPDKRGLGFVFFENKGGGKAKGQIYVDGTNKTVQEGASIISKAISEVLKAKP